MRTRLLPTLLTVILAVIAAPSGVSAARTASGVTFYVDGKQGSDGNAGTDAAHALKTIAAATSRIPGGTDGAGYTVVVKGYADYIYRERPIPTDFSSAGTAAAPIVFRASGYVPGAESYVRPIVFGSEKAPAAGQSWTATSTPGVYVTPWTLAPHFYGVLTGSLKTALFQDETGWLWEQTSLSALGTRAASGVGGYWWDRAAGKLYVSAIGSPTGSGRNPTGHAIEVIVRPAFYFKGNQGVSHVEVRGFDVRHAANGIAFDNGTDDSVAADNVVDGNFLMGITTAGVMVGGRPNAATGNVVERNRGAYNTLQMIKIDEGTVDSVFCDNVAHDNALRGILVQGDAPGTTGYTGGTRGVLLCRNTLYDHDYNPTGSIYNNAAGITIANDAKDVTFEENTVFGNDVGIHLTQERDGLHALTGIVLRGNVVHDNRRFGLNIFDGTYGDGAGTLLVERDIYYANGMGVMVSPGSSNKTIRSSTIYGNAGDGIRVGVAGKPKASVTVTASLITDNGGYGVWLVGGNAAALSYDGLAANALGPTKGAPTSTATNTLPAGYLSTTPSSPDFLTITTLSAQIAAGPGGTPIGARWRSEAPKPLVPRQGPRRGSWPGSRPLR